MSASILSPVHAAVADQVAIVSSGSTPPKVLSAGDAANFRLGASAMELACQLADQLGWEWESTRGSLRLTIPATDEEKSEPKSVVIDAIESCAAEAELREGGHYSLRWLAAETESRSGLAQREPASGRVSVSDIAGRLLPSYQMKGGQVHLLGCLLEDQAFLRLAFPSPTDPGEVEYVYVAPDGSTVPPQTIAALQLETTVAIDRRVPRMEEGELAAFESAGRRMVAQRHSERDPNAIPAEPLQRELIWVKYATGKIEFTAGESSLEHPFVGWAQTVEASEVTCPASGRKTYNLQALSGERIVASESVVECAHSGKQVVDCELVTCAVTGKRVLEEFTEKCPVLGRPALEDQFEVCPRCNQRVSRAAIEGGSCRACNSLRAVDNDDPRLVWIVDEHLGLEKWKRWKIAETETSYIAEATRYVRKILVVVDRQSLAIRHLAAGGRFSRQLEPIPEADWADKLNA